MLKLDLLEGLPKLRKAIIFTITVRTQAKAGKEKRCMSKIWETPGTRFQVPPPSRVTQDLLNFSGTDE